jgi:2,5-diketo-D-gluconate reductase A
MAHNGVMSDVREVPTVRLPGDVVMPMVGFGTWPMRGHRARDAVTTALQAGYRHVDTARMYANEEEVGHALRDSGLPRHEVFLTSKLRATDAGNERAALTDSLRTLGTDYIDLWLVHWPPRGSVSVSVWREMLALRDEGLARAVGVSNYSLAQVDEIAAATGQAPAVNQIHWNPRRYDGGLLQGLRERGVAVEGYSPLKDTNLNDPVLTEIAWAHSVTPAQVVLRWHLDRDVTVIVKSADPKRIVSNLDLFRFSLSPDELARIDGLAARR